jgi:hypothetical protein
MARSHLRFTLKDRDGNAIQNARLQLRLHATSILVSDAWTAESGGVTTGSELVTNSQGEVECWFDVPKAVDISVTDNGGTAYRVSDLVGGVPTSFLTWTAFPETVEVFPPPADIATNATVVHLAGSEFITGTKYFAGLYIRNEYGMHPKHHDFGAVGDGVADDTIPLRNCLAACYNSATNPATTTRIATAPMKLGAASYKVTGPISAASVSGLVIEGEGINLTSIVAAEGSVFENVLDLNGVIRSKISGMKIVPCQFAGTITAGIDWYWDYTTSAFSASSCAFEDLWIVGRFTAAGFGVSRKTNGARQCDHGHFRNIIIDGALQDDATYWQQAWVLGNGLSGNQTNYDIEGWSISFCKVGIKLDGAKSVWFSKGGAGGQATVVYNAGYDFHMVDFECEGIGRLYDMPGASTASQSVEFSNGEIQPLMKFTGSSVDPAGVVDGEFIRHYVPGVFTIRNVRLIAGPTGVVHRMRFNPIGPPQGDLTVLIDGLTTFQAPDVLLARPTYVSGAVNVNIRGYQQLDTTTQQVTAIYPGPFKIDPSPRRRDGTVALVGGTATITTTAVTANSQIVLSVQTPGGTVGIPSITAKTAGTSFVITSTSATDTSTIFWQIVDVFYE